MPVKESKPIYAMRFRPVSSFTLPPGIVTEWVRTPRTDGLVVAGAFPELERSTYPYGEFTTSRELTEDELESFQIERVDAPHKRRVRRAELKERLDALRTERIHFASDADDVAALGQMIDQVESELEELEREDAAHGQDSATAAAAG